MLTEIYFELDYGEHISRLIFFKKKKGCFINPISSIYLWYFALTFGFSGYLKIKT